MRNPLIVAAALAAAAACASLTPPPAWESDPEAMRIAAEWLERSQGFDALEAWQMSGSGEEYRFAVARKWTGTSVKVLAYVLTPVRFKDAAYLTHLEPGVPSNGWRFLPGSKLRRVPEFLSSLRGAVPLGSGAESIGSEVASPVLLEDHAYRRAPDEVVDGEPCRVIESRPLTERRRRGYDRLVYWISQRSGAAVRRAYFRGVRELRRVSIRANDVSEVKGRLIVKHVMVHDGDGDITLFTLHNSVPDVDLPDTLFTMQTLKARRFPSF